MGSVWTFLEVVLLVIQSNGIARLDAAPAGDSLVNSELTGSELVKMGNALNKPMLTLLGETFFKMKYNIDKHVSGELETLKSELCKTKNCSDWTEWSPCSANVKKTFGASTRYRACGGSTEFCPTDVAETKETDIRICQGELKCKSGYTLTENKFCLKVITVQKSWKSAQEDCQQDGGYLVNIDSELKAKDVNETLEKTSVTNDLWIDGTRILPNGEWKYKYGGGELGYSNWRSGEPESVDDCKAYVLYSGTRQWRGRKCPSTYYFLCELV